MTTQALSTEPKNYWNNAEVLKTMRKSKSFSVRIGSDKRRSENKIYDFLLWDEAERFAKLYKVEHTIQVKL